MNAAEPGEQSSVDSGPGTQADQTAGQRPRRGRLSPEQEREVAQLYAEGSTPTSAIRERFGIGESALYRILQQQGVALRGRVQAGSSRPAGAPRAESSNGRRRAGARVATREGGGRSPARAATARVGGAQAATPPAEGAQARFRIRFEGERVVQARTVSEALRQMDTLGTAEIISVVREG